MDIRKRKVGFYYLILKTEDNGYEISDELKKIFQFIKDRNRVARKIDLSEDKFCFLEKSELNKEEIIQKFIFKSANHNYRSPLVNRETVTERDNPKELNEGEVQKAHFVLKYKEGDAILLAEKQRTGLSTRRLVEYLNHFKKKFESEKEQKLNYKFGFEIIAKDNLRDELERMNRVLNACVYVDKQILGGEALNFAQRLDTVANNIVIDIKASRGDSIKDTVKDLLALANGGNRSIQKIRIKGKNENNNDITIDTEFIEKIEYVEAQLNKETGEVNSAYLLHELVEIANNL